MSRVPPISEEARERILQLLPARTLSLHHHARFARASDAELLPAIELTVRSARDGIDGILRDDTLDDDAKATALIDLIVMYLYLVALGGMTFDQDGNVCFFRVDSPGPTPTQEAAIEKRLATLHPLIAEALVSRLKPL